MNAKEFYLKETGYESLDQVEEFDTPEEVIGLMKKYAEHCEVPDREEEMREMLKEILNHVRSFPFDGIPSKMDRKIEQLLNK